MLIMIVSFTSSLFTAGLSRTAGRGLLPLLFLVLLAGCPGHEDSRQKEDPAGNNNDTPYGEILGTGTFSLAGIGSWDWFRLRLPHSEGNAYAVWFEPSGSRAEPAVLFAQPYGGVTWSGEAVDERWTNAYLAYIAGGGMGDLCGPDVDGPAWDILSPGEVCFAPTLEAELGSQSAVFLLNNVGVLHVFGRFYAGGNVWNDVQDIVAGLRYLQNNTSRVDTSAIGLFGGSWGGFETLYATAYAPAGFAPSATLAMAPVIDFGQLQDFIVNDLPGLTSPAIYPDYVAFYDPYLRRLNDVTGNPPAADYTGFTAADIAMSITSPVLIPHDDHDTILPATTSHDFVTANSVYTQGFWYSRSNNMIDYNGSPLTHGLIIEDPPFPAVLTFSFDFLLQRILPTGENLLLTYASSNIRSFFSNIRSYQVAGLDVEWLLPRIIELADDAVILLDLENGLPISGPALVVQEIDAVWGTDQTAATIQQWLINNGLPAP